MADEFELVNTGMGGKLTERLEAMRDTGGSMVSIAQQFTDEGYPVSRETIRRWLIRVGLPTTIVPGPPSGSAAAPGPGELSTTGSRSEGPFRDVHPSPPAGSGSSSPGGGVPSAPGPVHGLDKGAVAPTPRGARSGGSPSLDRRSA